MTDITEAVDELASGQYEPGEHLVATTRVARKQSVKSQAAFGVLGGMVANAVKAKVESKHPHDSAATNFPQLPSMTLGLTDRRVIVCRNSTLSNRPEEMVTALNLDSITNARFEKGKLTSKLFVTTADGTEDKFQVLRGSGAEEFADALNQAITTSVG